MNKKLVYGEARTVADAVIDSMLEQGFVREEIIPGLVQAIIMLAEDDDQLIDEAADLLADGGVPDEDE